MPFDLYVERVFHDPLDLGDDGVEPLNVADPNHQIVGNFANQVFRFL